MIRNIILFNLPIELVCDLIPVLLCGCDNWGYKDIGIIEKIPLKLLEYVLCLKSTTPSYLIYGKSGRYSIYVSVYSRMKLTKISQGQENMIVFTVYKYLPK